MITRPALSEDLAVPFGLSLEVMTTNKVSRSVDSLSIQTEVVDQKAATVSHIKKMMEKTFCIEIPKARKIRRSRRKGK